MSNIEWTDRTWNCTVGCTEVSRGCLNCYAARMAWRLMHNPKVAADYAGIAKKLDNGRIVFTGKVNLLSDRLQEPLKVKKPTKWFVDSMSDLFHEDVPFKYIYEVFAVMEKCPQHIFQILTKRPNRMADFISEYGYIHFQMKNVWLGVSVENQKTADDRGKWLRCVSDFGWITWVSNEPCVGLIDWKGWEFIEWMVTGGESGPGADPMHPHWARAARDFCEKNGIKYFFKQWGAWAPWAKGDVFTEKNPLVCMKPTGELSWIAGDMGSGHVRNYSMNYEETDQPMQKVGKHEAGRLFDGRTYDEYPNIANRESRTT